MKNKINIPDELYRLKVKDLAEEARARFARKGLSDIFDILSETALLIRKPMDIDGLSGFITYFHDRFIVYLNSSYTLGHERYTGAHELYHILHNEDILKREKVFLDKGKYKEEEKKADVFAAEFLMPEDYIKEMFYRFVKLDKGIQPKHIVRMHNFFKVSYKGMLKRLVQLNLCPLKEYSGLLSVSSLENEQELQSLTIKEGFNTDLIVPSNENYIPKEYLIYTRSNYENEKISRNEYERILGFIEMSI